MGYGWDFSFNTNLLREYDASGNETGMILKDGDGSIHRFSKNADGTYNSPKGAYMDLKYNTALKCYEIKRKDNITYSFNDKMQLVKFTEPNGNAITLNYNKRGNIDTVTNSVGDVSRLSYDKTDRLIKIADPSGREFNYVYDDSSDKLTKMYIIIENNVEYSEEYIYDGSYQNITAIKDPKKNTTSFDYIDSKISGITDPIGEKYNINYSAGSTSITNRGKTVSFSYNADGGIIQKTDQLNHSINDEYDSNCNVTRMYCQNIIGGTVKTVSYTYTYDSKGNLLTITDPLNNVNQYSDYNSFNEAGEVKEPIGPGAYAITKYTYDDKGNMISSTDPENRKATYTYYSDGNTNTVTDNFGNTTTYNYDGKGRLIKKTEPLGKTTEILSYDAQGNPTKIKDALGHITQYVYDVLGRKTSEVYTGSDGIGTKAEYFSYDLDGNLKFSTDRMDNTTGFDYDQLNRLVMTAYPDGKTASVFYTFGTDNNMIVIYKDGENRESKEYYDSAGRLIKKESGGTYATYEYDYLGSVIKTKDAEGRESDSVYDELGRVIKTVDDPNGINIQNEFTYDLLGNKLTSKDGEGNITNYSYDKIGRLVTVSNNVSGTAISTRYQYDIKDGGTIVNKTIDALGRESLTYLDALGRKVKDVNDGTPQDGISETTLYQYDLNGNILQLTKNDSSVINYRYDSWDRLTKVQYDSNNYTTYGYDDNGNRLSMTDVKNGSPIVTSYAYDVLNRLKQTVQDGNTVNYEYDGSGNKIRTYYSDGSSIKNIVYKYDIYNRLQSIGIGYGQSGTDNYGTVREYSYTPSGYVDSVKNYRKFDTKGTDFTNIKYTYNTAGELINAQYLDNGTAKKEEYTIQYDKRGLIKNETSYTNYDTAKTVNKAYSYDELGRLMLVDNTTESKKDTYTYDNVGNRLTMNDGTNSFSYGYNQFNQMIDIKKNGQADSTFSYDLNGNQKQEISKKDVGGTIKDVTTDYTYDKADRLINTSVSDGTTVKNTANYYNGDGQRIKRNADGIVTKYYYEGDDILYTTDGNNVKVNENILDLDGVIIASKRFDGIYKNMYFTYNYDIRGSVTNIINPEGTVVKGYDYDEFGGTREKGDTAFKNDTKFTGAVHDSSSNLYLMGSRFYNPDTGRFLTQDTYSGSPYEPWTSHLYSYCDGNPTSMTDPTGHMKMLVGNGEGGGISRYVPQSSPAPKPANRSKKKKANSRRVETGVNKVASGGLCAAVSIAAVGVAVSVLTGGTALPIYMAAAAVTLGSGGTAASMGISDVLEGVQDICYGSTGSETASTNLIRDYVYQGNYDVYYFTEIGSVMVASQGMAILGNVPKSEGAGKSLTNGARMKTNKALDAASDFLGPGYKDMGNGRFVSADGIRQVRMGDSDILGQHGGGPHMNFETMVPNPAKPGKMMIFPAPSLLGTFPSMAIPCDATITDPISVK